MYRHYFSTSKEEGILRLSIAVTLFMTLLGGAFGLLASSLTLLFDAVYELVDVAMTGLALLVSRLITLSASRPTAGQNLCARFSLGFWRPEPTLQVLTGLVLTGGVR